MKNWIIYGGAALGIAFIALAIFWKTERYPILVVNGTMIPARDYYVYLDGFERYREVSKDPIDVPTVKRAALMTFVVDAIAHAELDRRGAGLLAESETDAALAGEDRAQLEKAAQDLYGWDVATFRRFTILPQARLNTLSAELEKEGKQLNVWLREALLGASVSVYGVPYEWNDGELVSK